MWLCKLHLWSFLIQWDSQNSKFYLALLCLFYSSQQLEGKLKEKT